MQKPAHAHKAEDMEDRLALLLPRERHRAEEAAYSFISPDFTCKRAARFRKFEGVMPVRAAGRPQLTVTDVRAAKGVSPALHR